MLKDCQTRLILTGDAELGDALTNAWPGLPERALFSQILAKTATKLEFSPVRQRPDDELLTIIYTSGTSGESKGVCLSDGNLNHMIGCTTQRLDQLMRSAGKASNEPDRVFLYAPMNFAASWMLMLSAFSPGAE